MAAKSKALLATPRHRLLQRVKKVMSPAGVPFWSPSNRACPTLPSLGQSVFGGCSLRYRSTVRHRIVTRPTSNRSANSLSVGIRLPSGNSSALINRNISWTVGLYRVLPRSNLYGINYHAQGCPVRYTNAIVTRLAVSL